MNCECADKGCPTHEGKESCEGTATCRIRRIDVGDCDYFEFCDPCADDALASGVFAREEDDDE